MKIYVMFVLAATAALASGSHAKSKSPVLDKCEVAKIIRRGGVVDIKGYSLEDYMCLASQVSGFNSSLHKDPEYYGIFQISSYKWCNDNAAIRRKNLCGIMCSALLNRKIKDDVKCLKRIVTDEDGLEEWPAWTQKCRGKDLSEYTRGCIIIYSGKGEPGPSVTAN